MFDECKSYFFTAYRISTHTFTDVEHATTGGAAAPGALPLPQIEYQGFEPSPYEPNDPRTDIDELAQVIKPLVFVYVAHHPFIDKCRRLQ